MTDDTKHAPHVDTDNLITYKRKCFDCGHTDTGPAVDADCPDCGGQLLITDPA